VIPFQIFSGSPELQPTWPLLLNIKKGGWNFLNIHLWNYWANWN
jgi:hypothetical protein